jgi:glycosyltransferase involved in cell wall biosynthesis
MFGKQLLTIPARLTRWKGQEDFIEIIQALIVDGQNVHGAIVGSAHPKKQEYAEELRHLIKSMDLQDHITMCGHRNDLKEILSLSSIVFSLSTEPEAFGRTTIEALSLGTPVIGYSHGGVKEQLEALLPQGAVPVGGLSGVVHKIQEWNTSLPVPEANITFTLDAMYSGILRVYTEPSLDEI